MVLFVCVCVSVCLRERVCVCERLRRTHKDPISFKRLKQNVIFPRDCYFIQSAKELMYTNMDVDVGSKQNFETVFNNSGKLNSYFKEIN